MKLNVPPFHKGHQFQHFNGDRGTVDYFLSADRKRKSEHKLNVTQKGGDRKSCSPIIVSRKGKEYDLLKTNLIL